MLFLKNSLLTTAFVVASGFMLSLLAQEILTPEKMHAIPRIGSPKLSPDATWLAYSRTEVNVEENNSKSSIQLLNLADNQTKTISDDSNSVYSARWVAKDRIWYLTSTDGNTHIWETNLAGEKKQITKGDFSVKMFGLSKNGEAVWVVRDVQFPTLVSAYSEDLPKTTGARIYDGLMYRHWTSWYGFKHQHVFYAKVNNGMVGEFVDIMAGEMFDSPLKPFGGGGQIDIHPGGNLIAYTSKKLSGAEAAKSTNSEIYLYNATTMKTENISEGNPGYDTYPSFSPDGKWLAWLSMATAGYEADKNRIILRNMVSGDVYDLTTEFPNGADAIQWDPVSGSNKLYILAGTEATYNIFVADWDSPTKVNIKQLTSEEANYQEMSIAVANGETKIAASRMSMSQPTEIYAVSPSDGAAKRLTTDTDVVWKNITKGKVEKRWIPTTDGQEMLTWIIYPPNFDPNKKYPTLLYCQGGPQSAVSQFFSYRWNFQMMAANDYIIVAPNRRGLPTFGAKWNEQISGDWGGQAMEDLLSAIDQVKEEPFVDEERLGAVGASFGGYSVFWLAGNHQERFKTFISHCGVFNLTSMYGSTEEIFFVNHDMGGPYWEETMPVSYSKHSPHLYVQNWDTPILVIQNELDFRVPLSQGMEAFTAAQLQGIPSRLFYFEDEGHWVNKPQNSILWNRVFFDWLDTYLK